MDEKADSEKSSTRPAARSEKRQADDLIVVGVGASAGGLEACTDLLRHLPPATGAAFVLVHHLDPHHDSALPELLATRTQMPVAQVHSNAPIQADRVYIIPPNMLMRVRNRSLTLEAMPATAERFRPIDVFFTSLAEEFRFNSVGVVLSGTASDGTLGLKAIKAAGGITFAQNQTARFDSMPRSAVAAGVVDFVLPPRRIAEELVAIAQRRPRLNQTEGEATGDYKTLDRLLLLLRKNTGVDFTQYKQPTILRRLNRRMVVRKVENSEQYYTLLQEEPAEAKALFDDLLINVTDFFRDPDVFEAAKQTMFPAILRDRRQPLNLRVWVPGCSSGEEVYSMAIALVEFLESEDLDCTIQMFGSDISDNAIDKARAGIYGESSMASVSPERVRRFFVRTETGYQISRAIREMCIFSRHNLAKDPPLSRMDLISCQNVLIYFSPSLQRRIIATLGYALQPGGCLILGPSETLGGLSEHFVTLDEKHKIYCRKTNSPSELLTLFAGGVEDGPVLSRAAPALPEPEPPKAGARLHRYVNEVVLSRYGPAGVVVDERLRITEHRGDASPYLAPDVQPFADLMNAVRAELRASLSTAIEQARRTGVTVVAENASGSGLQSSTAPITVVPLTLAGMAPHFLILFGRAGEEAGPDDILVSASGDAETAPPAPVSLDQENAHLRQELKATREYLQAVIEELRSANEEAQSSNEELQSTNEEMQTSKEELQSANEELNTINAEMQSRNADLAQLNDDLTNLLASMNMPIVMTGIDLRIRRFTPMAEKVLRLISSDVGRPIADLKPRINVPNLERVLQHVLDTLQPHEQEVQDQEGRLYLLRIRPYRTSDNRIDGTVLQLLDVSDLRRSLEEIKQARDYAEGIVNTVREPLVVLDQNLAIRNANSAFYDVLHVSQAGAVGQSIFQVGRGRFDLPKVHSLFRQLAGGFEQLKDIEIDYLPESGETRILTLNARRLATPEQQLILMVFEDITERKREAEARYRRLFESARDGIVLADSETGEILDLNPFTEGLLGYSRRELVGSKLWEIEPMRNLPKLRAALDQVRDQGVLRFEALTLRTKEGRDVQVEVLANLYSEGDRHAIQFHMRDGGERKKFERELQETQKLEGLGLLAGGIAHDFNNLLTGIIGNASLAYADLPADTPARMRLREVMQAGERAAFLTRQLLAYAGRGRGIAEKIDVGDFVRDISALLRTSIPKSVDLKLDLEPNLPSIEADPAQIQQMVTNLVINGAEAIGGSGVGKVEIRASVRKISAREAAEIFRAERPAPGNYVQLEVSDTGSGMDEATKARIFDPFFTTKLAGRGLGLAAVQGIVKGHRGAIRVYSTPGQGTTFVVVLPASQAKAGEARGLKANRASIPAGSVALVIGDEETVRSLAGDILSRAGMRVLTAENGKAGVEIFREHSGSIAVVILDLQMPGVGGQDASAQLQEINPEVPVILSSGFDESEAERRYSGVKAARFLQKPYSAENLVRAVALALKGRKR